MYAEPLLDREVRAAIEKADQSVLLRAMIPEAGDISAWAAGQRARRAALLAARPSLANADVSVSQHRVPGEAGAPEVPVRVYTPEQRVSPGPALLWLYGGAFMFGSLDEWHDQYVQFARQHRVVVVGVEYRKAPDDPFPAAVDDCYAALLWMSAHGSDLGIDPERVVVGGVSAGATYTAALTLMARDRNGPRIAFQAPLFGALDDRLVTHSSRAIDYPLIVHAAQYERAWRYYRGPNPPAETSPYCAPARATDLTGLPPAYMAVGEVDPMRDENIQYAMRLMADGVSVELHVYPGAPHGIGGPDPESSLGKRFRAEMQDVFQRALWGADTYAAASTRSQAC